MWYIVEEEGQLGKPSWFFHIWTQIKIVRGTFFLLVFELFPRGKNCWGTFLLEVGHYQKNVEALFWLEKKFFRGGCKHRGGGVSSPFYQCSNMSIFILLWPSLVSEWAINVQPCRIVSATTYFLFYLLGSFLFPMPILVRWHHHYFL